MSYNFLNTNFFFSYKNALHASEGINLPLYLTVMHIIIAKKVASVIESLNIF